MSATLSYLDLNASLNLYDLNGLIQFDKDKEAARSYFLEHVNQNTMFFHDIEEKIAFLIKNEYYEKEFLDQYDFGFVKGLYKHAYAKKFRFPTFVGSYKFFNSYALKTFDGKSYLERYEDRVVAVALFLAAGKEEKATSLVDVIMSGQFQPATPTFLNAGRAQRGELVSCFPAGSLVDTVDGRKPIETVAEGDLVLTHDGSYKAVTGSMRRMEKAGLVTLRVAGSEPLVLTPEHPVLVAGADNSRAIDVLRKKDGSGSVLKWVAAQNVSKGDYVVAAFPTEVNSLTEISLLNYLPNNAEYVEQDGLIHKKNKDKKNVRKGNLVSQTFIPIKNAVPLNEDFGRFVGYFLSEGYVIRNLKDGQSIGTKGLNFTFGSHEQAFLEDVSTLAQTLFGVEPKTKTNRDGSTNVYVNSSALGQAFLSLLGTGYDVKRLPVEFLHANAEFQRGLLIGTYRGDGCTTSSAVTMSLVNPELIHQLRNVALRLGMLARTRSFINQAGNLTSNLDITGFPGNEWDFIMDVAKNTDKFIGANPKFSNVSRWAEGNPAYRVEESHFTPGEVEVFNLEVENNHTYSVAGHVVHNCFLLRTEDNMESISRAINSSLQLSKRGGGVALVLTNLREGGAPIKKVEGQSSGVVPVMKLLEDAFSYANQLGQRNGSGAVYLNAHHPDIEIFLDTKRENADEKIRIKSLSLGIVVPDITFELARDNKDMYLFSPYDVERVYGKPMSDLSITEHYWDMVENDEIRKKKIKARGFLQTVADVQIQSGYPYIMFEDTVNRANPLEGYINMSNLCVTGDSQILTAEGYRTVSDLYGTQEDFDVVVDTRARDMELEATGVSVESSTRMFKTAEDADVFKIRTSEGFEIKATEWHKFYVRRGSELVKIPLAEMEVGDKVLVQSETGTFGNIDKVDLAYLAGVIAADGTFAIGENYSSVKIALYGEKADHAAGIGKAVSTVLEGRDDLVERQATLTPEFKASPHLNRTVLSSAPLAKLLAENGFTPETKTDVPQFVLSGTRATQEAYVSGLFQMDGTITGSVATKVFSIELGSISHELLVSIQRLLLNLGVYTRIYAGRKEETLTLLPDGKGGEAKYVTQPTWSIRATSKNERDALYAMVDWRSTHRQRWEKLSAGGTRTPYQTHRHTATVSSIEFYGVEDVYDVTVENGNSVIFNGIATGNCSEILQINTPSTFKRNLNYDHVGRDISCNLGSLNVAKVMEHGDFAGTVDTAVRALTNVSKMTSIEEVPSIVEGNDKLFSIGLGAMNLAGFFGSQRMHYGDEESLDFTDMFFYLMNYHSIVASNNLAVETGEKFYEFEKSTYADGSYFTKYVEQEWVPKTEKVARIFREAGIDIPTQEDWKVLAEKVKTGGLLNGYRLAVPPTGSISYLNNSTASIHPINAKVEIRKEGTLGRVYYPAYGMTNDNLEYYKDAYEIGNAVVSDVYAAATQHIDQGLSLTFFYTEGATTRDYIKSTMDAWKKGIKTIYYSRIRAVALGTTDMEECVSCTL